MTLPELKQFFQQAELPETIRLSDGEMIDNVNLFVTSHISVLENNSGKVRYLPYYLRLLKLYELLNQPTK
jgi:hypothetical protein